jgi:ribosomal protein S18 acetylase RimI-like enzyme
VLFKGNDVYRVQKMDWECRDSVTIARTWVDPKVRRQSIASTLTDTVKDWGCEKGVERLELQVTENNEAAKSFYKYLDSQTLAGVNRLSLIHNFKSTF